MAIQSRRATIRDIRYKMSRIILDVLFNKTFMARVSNSRRSEEEEDERRASDSLLCNQ